MRVTPEAYVLFDTGAPSVPELCDAFKYRFGALSSIALLAQLLPDILIYRIQPPRVRVVRLLTRVHERLGTSLPGIGLQEGCRYASLLGRQILTPGRALRSQVLQLQRILERPMVDTAKVMHPMEDFLKGLQALHL